MMNGTIQCNKCGSKLVALSPRSVSRAYDKHRSQVSSKHRALNFLLVIGDCILVGLQPILVYMSKVDGKFKFSPISVNFLTEFVKILFAVVMLIFQARHQKVGEKNLLSIATFVQAARNNVLLAVPALLYAINNYLKFIMQLYFNPATVKMLSNMKVLVIAILLKIIMRRRFSIIQWEALALLLIGISVNQLKSLPEGSMAMGFPVTMIAYVYTLVFITVPSMASVFNEYALKSQFDTSIYLQNLFLYGYGAIFNFLGIIGTAIFKGPSSFNILEGHSRATMFLICINAAQGILSSFFFKYADTILKKYSSTVATIFTGIASAALFGHTLTMNFILGISIVFISMHQFFSPMAKVKDEIAVVSSEKMEAQRLRLKEDSFVNMAAGTAEDVTHRAGHDERQSLLPI
ncbi:CMP-sialic acid transporter 4-like [Zingiber officinale]|uniref:CMP-sialic acid transporter 4-like n=1 Tax=Zingiber officinale TaxID=94328 RepID=UPI001C4AE8BA|nr:CMP-sialic acid transporter 4-like [Zingiber officinale]